MIVLLISCKTTKEYIEIPVEVVKKEFITNTKIDSIFVKDSVDRYISGDTVYLYKFKTEYRNIYITDTISKIDSIPKIIKQTIVEEKEINKIYWWQKSLMWLGIVTLLIGGIYIIRLIKRNKIL